MIPFLKQRAEHLSERMDDPDCDREKLFQTYRELSDMNGLITRWETLFKAYIAPLAKDDHELQILDIGCGGGDICLKMVGWAREKNIRVRITGIDPDPRALEFTETQTIPENVEFRHVETSELVELGEMYDVVISNYLLHHLTNEEIYLLCRQSEQLARRLVLFNDLRRSNIAFAGFAVAAPIRYRNSFTVRDGLTSIRRSFTRPELQRIVPEGWHVKKLIPWRLLVILEKWK